MNSFLKTVDVLARCLPVLGALVLPVLGQTFTVPGSFPTIQDAVLGAPDGATILVSDGTYGFINAENLNKNLYIQSVNGPQNAIITGNGTGRVLRIENALPGGDPNKNIVFDGFQFRDGVGIPNVSAAVTIANASPVFLNCRFVNHVGTDKGGAVLIYGPASNPTFVNSRFENNKATHFGGAVLVSGDKSQATFYGCHFEGNTTRMSGATNYGQGGAIKFAIAGGKVVNSTFINNSTAYSGGAIMVLTHFTDSDTRMLVEVEGCRFEGNFTQSWPGSPERNPFVPTEGGAVMVESFVRFNVRGSIFENNQSATGGAIMVYRGELDVQDSVFDGNIANGTNLYGGGGAIGINSNDAAPPNYAEAEVWLTNVMIRNNIAPVGGGISAQGDVFWGTGDENRGRLHLNRVVVEGNTATTANSSYGNAGGIFLNLMDVSGEEVYILNNHAENLGGALVLVQNTRLVFNNSYLVGNSADWTDPLIHAPSGSGPTPVFTQSTLAYNGGSGTAELDRLVAIPERSFGSQSYLTYLNLPYSNPVISNQTETLPNRGGYAAGTVKVEGITSTRTHMLITGEENPQITVPYARNARPSRAFGGTTPVLPARLEAEHFDTGGARRAYFDRTTPNEGGSLRTSEQVDIAAFAPASNGFLVGWTNAGEWLHFNIRSPGGNYVPRVRVAAPNNSGRFYLALNGQRLTPNITVPDTGGFNVLQEIELAPVSIPQGFSTLSLVVVQGGFNLDYIDIGNLQPTLALSTTLLTRSVRPGGTVLPRSFQIWNSGSESLSYTISGIPSWLSLSTASGSSSGEKNTVSVQFHPEDLEEGAYVAQLSIQSPEAVNSPRTLTVRFWVLGPSRPRNDFDGDGLSDIGAYFAPGGNWYLFQSQQGFRETQFGFAGTIPVTGDFDGDGLADFGCYHPPTGMWYLFRSQKGFFQTQFGFEGTIPVVGDFDGDGIDDFGCYHPPTGRWFFFTSTLGFQQTTFGFDGTIPIVGDFDGDGVDDFGCYHPPSGSWFIFRSSLGFYQTQFGFAGTLPVVGDFDGDGKDDFGCYHPESGNWYLFRSQKGFFQTQFGFAGTIPVVGDFDGDGIDDFGCYHPPTGGWFLFRSQKGFYQTQFGFEGTTPL